MDIRYAAEAELDSEKKPTIHWRPVWEREAKETSRVETSRVVVGFVDRGFRIEYGVATAGMGSQQGDLRDEFAFLQQRDLLESISLDWDRSGFLTAGSLATRCCCQCRRWSSFVGRMGILLPICNGTRVLRIRLLQQRRTKL